MKFANIQAWHLLLCLPLIAAALHMFYHHRRKIMSRFVQEALVDELAQGFSLKLYRMKASFLMAAFVFMVAALSRPQWGYHERPVKRHGLDILVAIDVSKSMLTRDVLPSRLERTKLAVRDLVMKLNGSDHIGLVAFAGDAMLMCPFTYDYNGFLLSLDDLSPSSIPRGGTDISAAIDEMVQAYQGMPDSDKAAVLITDGEEQEGDAIDAARRAKEKGIRIFTVGVGTKAGDLILVANADGQTGFLKDADGNVVKSHLNENLLQQIAYITGGAYVHSGAEQFGLDYLYDRQLSKLKKHDAQVKEAKIYDERFQWPLTVAFLLLLMEMMLDSRFRGNDKKEGGNDKRRGNGNSEPVIPAKAGIQIIVFAVVLIFSMNAFASVAGEVNKANDLYKQGKFDDSLALYQEALGRDQNSPVVKYDLGTALYKKGDYDKALGYLEQAAQDKKLKINPAAEYNLGNALYKSGVQKESGNVDAAIKTLQDALGQYSDVIQEAPNDQDAQYNMDIVKKEIERLKQQKQQQQQQQNQQNQQKQNQQQKQQQQNQQNQQKQNQQNKQQKTQHQQQQNQQQGSRQQQQQQSQAESQKQIDRKQAQDLLEEYEQNEEPKKLLNYMPQKADDRPVVKDW